MADTELQLRKTIIDKCRWMNATGLNQGTSGNISARHGDVMAGTKKNAVRALRTRPRIDAFQQRCIATSIAMRTSLHADVEPAMILSSVIGRSRTRTPVA